MNDVVTPQDAVQAYAKRWQEGYDTHDEFVQAIAAALREAEARGLEEANDIQWNYAGSKRQIYGYIQAHAAARRARKEAG